MFTFVRTLSKTISYLWTIATKAFAGQNTEKPEANGSVKSKI